MVAFSERSEDYNGPQLIVACEKILADSSPLKLPRDTAGDQDVATWSGNYYDYMEKDWGPVDYWLTRRDLLNADETVTTGYMLGQTSGDTVVGDWLLFDTDTQQVNLCTFEGDIIQQTDAQRPPFLVYFTKFNQIITEALTNTEEHESSPEAESPVDQANNDVTERNDLPTSTTSGQHPQHLEDRSYHDFGRDLAAVFAGGTAISEARNTDGSVDSAVFLGEPGNATEFDAREVQLDLLSLLGDSDTTVALHEYLRVYEAYRHYQGIVSNDAASFAQLNQAGKLVTRIEDELKQHILRIFPRASRAYVDTLIEQSRIYINFPFASSNTRND